MHEKFRDPCVNTIWPRGNPDGVNLSPGDQWLQREKKSLKKWPREAGECPSVECDLHGFTPAGGAVGVNPAEKLAGGRQVPPDSGYFCLIAKYALMRTTLIRNKKGDNQRFH
jgi:hypothetical protein